MFIYIFQNGKLKHVFGIGPNSYYDIGETLSNIMKSNATVILSNENVNDPLSLLQTETKVDELALNPY